MYNFKKFPGVTPPDPQHWLGGEGVKPPSGEILATGLSTADILTVYSSIVAYALS